jgi:hypothetical protein
VDGIKTGADSFGPCHYISKALSQQTCLNH